jgi:hypothetical protein
MTVRRATILDIDDCMDIARESYGSFDEVAALKWGVNTMLNPDVAFFRTDRAWGASGLVPVFYEPKGTRAAMLFLAARKGAAWEACQILRAMLAWAQSRGAAMYLFGEETGMNLAPLAKRVGAVVDRPSYRVDLSWEKSSAKFSTPSPAFSGDRPASSEAFSEARLRA